MNQTTGRACTTKTPAVLSAQHVRGIMVRPPAFMATTPRRGAPQNESGRPMAMKKAKIKAESLQYREAIRRARAAEQRGMYRAAVEAAMSAWPYGDEMVLRSGSTRATRLVKE